jgi:ATP-dependent Clp protease ATP-binding subunit ClpA
MSHRLRIRQILKGIRSLASRIASDQNTQLVRNSAVELSARYINDRKLPDKAIGVIDSRGAAQHLVAESKRRKTIGTKGGAVVAKIALT